MSISIYLLLLIILLVFNLVFWLLIIWFRILFNCELGVCCPDTESIADEAPEAYGNAGFLDDDPVSTPQRPFTVAEAMETPPSYEEAIKYDQFGFQVPPVQFTSPSALRESMQTNCQQESSHVTRVSRPTQLPSNPSRVTESRSRSSTGSVTALTPITEEESEDSPATVFVIDSVGLHASRLLETGMPKVDFPEGEQLKTHSSC